MNTRTVTFLVAGSLPQPYSITFTRAQNQLPAHCTCPSGENGLYCEHRLGILDGQCASIVSTNSAAVEEVVAWLRGTKPELALVNFRHAERQCVEAEAALAHARKVVALAMR